MSKEYNDLIAMGCNEEQASFAQAIANFSLHTIASKGHLNMHALIKGGQDEDTGRAALIVLEAPSIDDQSKDMFLETVRYVSHVSDADTAAITSETWMAPADMTPEETREMIEKHGSIGAFPEKREGVIVAITDQDFNKLMITYDLLRDKKGNIAEIKPASVDFSKPDGNMAGRIFQTFYSNEDRANPQFPRRLKIMEQMVQAFTTPNPGDGDNNGPVTYN